MTTGTFVRQVHRRIPQIRGHGHRTHSQVTVPAYATKVNTNWATCHELKQRRYVALVSPMLAQPPTRHHRALEGQQMSRGKTRLHFDTIDARPTGSTNGAPRTLGQRHQGNVKVLGSTSLRVTDDSTHSGPNQVAQHCAELSWSPG